MKSILLIAIALLTLISTGCPKYKPSVDFKNSNNLVSKINTHFAGKQSQYFSALNRNDTATAKRTRNELIEDALPYLDSAYEDFITDITAGRDRANFIADVVELGTTAAIGITNGERPLQILGVALTAFRGGRRSVDLNFFREQTTPILINKMDGNRARVRATILTREREEVDTYPIGAAISDIVAYYNAGTLVRAFTELQKDTAVLTRQHEDNLQVLKGVPLTPEATPAFRNLSVAASNALATLSPDVESTDAAKKTAATEKLKKIVLALEKDKDASAVLKNAGISSQDTDGVKLRDALIDIRAAAAMVNNTALLNTINQAIVDNTR